MRLGMRVAMLRNVSTLLLEWTPRLVLASMAGLEWVAFYHVAERLLSIPVTLTHGVSRSMLPALGEFAGQKDLPRFRSLFYRSTLWGGGAVVVALGITLAATPFLTELLFPADYAEPVYRFATILFWAGVCQAFSLGIDSFYIATNRIRTWYGLSFAGLIVCVPLAVWLIRTIPVAGAAFATVVLNAWLLVIVAFAFLWLSLSRERAW